MRQFLKALLLLPIAIIVVLLAVANRGPVTLSFDPFSPGGPQLSWTLPLFAVIFLSVMVGVGSWLTQSKHRRRERHYRREARNLRRDGERQRPHGGAGLPALTTSEPSRL